jgi:hypothetical protein
MMTDDTTSAQTANTACQVKSQLIQLTAFTVPPTISRRSLAAQPHQPLASMKTATPPWMMSHAMLTGPSVYAREAARDFSRWTW